MTQTAPEALSRFPMGQSRSNSRRDRKEVRRYAETHVSAEEGVRWLFVLFVLMK